jgi:hypothetical protein
MGFLPSRIVAIWLCCIAFGCDCGNHEATAQTGSKPNSSDPAAKVTGTLWAGGGPNRPSSQAAPRTPGSTAAPQPQPIQPQLLLRQARAALERRKTISATIHERIHLYDQELVGKGNFVQGPGDLFYLDLPIKVTGGDSYIQQRCDGEHYWLQKCVNGIPSVTRIDVKRVRAARAAHAQKNAAPRANGPPSPANASPPMLGLGGVAYLLDQLELWCVFTKVSQLDARGPDETSVYVLEGTWKPERMVFWLPEQRAEFEKGQPLNLDKLPPTFPDRIIVYLGRDDLFPRRIEYSAGPSRTFDDDETPPLVRIHFEGVQFDQPINPRQFMFDSSVVEPLDDTDGYLLRHGWQ